MNKSILIAILIVSLGSLNANAAKNTEVYKYERASELGFDAFHSKSYDTAFEHLIKASKLGNKEAQFATAILYMGGLGVEQDYTQAYLWLNVAAEVKHKKWRNLRDKMHKAFSKDQIKLLSPLVEEYKTKYGARAQEVSCYKRPAPGSNIKIMRCAKHLDSGAIRL